MLQSQHTQPVRSIDGIGDADASFDAFQVVYQSILDFIWRQYPVIVFVAAIGIAMGFTYLLTTPPSYTATATMIIDTKRVQLFQQQSMFTDLPIDTGAVESQVEILRSENIALAVIKKLHLEDDPEFTEPRGGLIGKLLSSVMGLVASIGPGSDSGPSSEVTSAHRAVIGFKGRLKIERVGLSYVMAINFRSLSADRAAQIANAVADAYIDDQLEAKYQAARRAGTWLQDRLRELREQASTAERAVVSFKNKNSMIDTGGRTINEQQLAELNSQLVLARTQTAEAQARVDRVRSILSSNSPEAAVNATVTDTLKNTVINELRTKYLEMSRREIDWATRYGANHLAVVNLRNQLREIQNGIRGELQRIAETYTSDLEIALQRQDDSRKQLDQAVAQSQVTNQAQVALRELESTAQSYQALYDNFLQRYMESVQQQSFPITEARVISAASRPLNKSHPRTLLVLGLAMGAGLAFGIMAGAWREFADRVFRTKDQVEALLESDCIALVPLVTEPGQKGKATDRGRETQNLKNVKLPNEGQRTIASPPGVYSTIVDAPFSAFAEAIRSVKVAIDLSPTVAGGKIIGFTSSMPSEGKSSIAVAVARLASQTGARTLLVDCDLRNPSLSRLLSPRAAGGLLEVVSGKSTLEKAIWSDPVTNLRFLPAALKARLAHSSEILASEQTRKFFDSLRHSYDYIFLDFAPLTPIVDVRASTNLVDSYVYVVAWGQTRIDFVEHALRSARGVHEHLLGVVLNKVNLASLGRYDGRGTDYYYHGNYHRYGYTE